MDDTGDQAYGSTLQELKKNLQSQADQTTEWLKCNLMCISPEKSKLIVMQYKPGQDFEEREKISISVEGKQISETRSEKHLGFYISSSMDWKIQLYGETWRKDDPNYAGLINQSRLALLKKLAKYTSKSNMQKFVNGIIMSKINYYLQVINNVWDKEIYREKDRRFRLFTKKDLQKLQTIINATIRIQMGIVDNKTPTKE